MSAHGEGAPVSDRAVLEYMYRVWGVDVMALRRRIAREAATGVKHGAVAVNRGGAKYILDGGVVVAVTHRSALPKPGG